MGTGSCCNESIGTTTRSCERMLITATYAAGLAVCTVDKHDPVRQTGACDSSSECICSALQERVATVVANTLPLAPYHASIGKSTPCGRTNRSRRRRSIAVSNEVTSSPCVTVSLLHEIEPSIQDSELEVQEVRDLANLVHALIGGGWMTQTIVLHAGDAREDDVNRSTESLQPRQRLAFDPGRPRDCAR